MEEAPPLPGRPSRKRRERSIEIGAAFTDPNRRLLDRRRGPPDVEGVHALVPVSDLELHDVAVLERLEAVTHNVAIVDEDVFARILLDEAVTFAVVEPLDPTLSHRDRTPNRRPGDSTAGCTGVSRRPCHRIGVLRWTRVIALF